VNNLQRAVSVLLATAVLVIAPVVRSDATESGIGTPSYVPTRVNYGSGAWAGPSATVTRVGKAVSTDVMVIGDSITARCWPDLKAALAAKGKTLSVIAQSGQDAAGLAELFSQETGLAGTTILAVGTNNVFTPPSYAPALKRMVAQVDGARWFAVDTYVGRAGTVQPHDIRNSGWVNGQLYAVAGAEHAISWVGALSAAVGRGRPLNYYLQDGVHPWASAGTGHGDGCAFWAATIMAGARL
jgi:hypothetical protein